MEERKRKATSAAEHSPLLLLTRCAASYTGQMLNSHPSGVDDAVTALCSFSFVAVHEFWWSLNHLWQLSLAQKDPIEGIQLNSAEMWMFCNCWQWNWLPFSSSVCHRDSLGLVTTRMVKAVLMRMGPSLKSPLSINVLLNLVGQPHERDKLVVLVAFYRNWGKTKQLISEIIS